MLPSIATPRTRTRLRAWALPLCGLLLLAATTRIVASQQLRPSPDSLRPPLSLSKPHEHRMEDATRVAVSAFLQAVESGDSAAVAQVLTPNALPESERAFTFCSRWVSRKPANGTRRTGALKLHWSAISVTSTSQEDTIAQASVEVTILDLAGNHRVLVSVKARREGDALRFGRVEGLFAGVCGQSVIQGPSQ